MAESSKENPAPIEQRMNDLIGEIAEIKSYARRTHGLVVLLVSVVIWIPLVVSFGSLMSPQPIVALVELVPIWMLIYGACLFVNRLTSSRAENLTVRRD